MTLFASLRDRISEAEREHHTTVLVLLPCPNRGHVVELSSIDLVTLHDAHGVVEFTSQTGSRFCHVADTRQISIISVRGNLGDHVKSQLPRVWACLEETHREKLMTISLGDPH